MHREAFNPMAVNHMDQVAVGRVVLLVTKTLCTRVPCRDKAETLAGDARFKLGGEVADGNLYLAVVTLGDVGGLEKCVDERPRAFGWFDDIHGRVHGIHVTHDSKLCTLDWFQYSLESNPCNR